MINLTNHEQFIAFLKMFVSGIAVGFVYDLCVYFLRGKNNKRAISDIVFWLSCCTIIVCALFYANELNLRLYLILGIIAGWGVYFVCISKTIEFFLLPLRTLIDTFFLLFKKIGELIKRLFMPLGSLPKKMKVQYNKYGKYFFRRDSNDKETKDHL